MKRGSRVSRRAFLQQAAAASVTLAAAGSGASAPNQEIALGMIGTGSRGLGLLRSFLKVPQVRMVALCDIDRDRLEAASQVAGGHKPQKFPDYQDLLRVSSLDAVIIATPCFLHMEHAVATLESNKHLYLEKPMGITVREVTEIEKAARRSKSTFQIGQQLRYDLRRKGMVEIIHSGELGRVGFVRASRMGKGYPPEKLWVNIAAQSGDVMVEQAVHNMDICNWVMNDHPVKAFGSGEQLIFHPREKDLIDFYSVIFQYSGNRHVNFCQNNISTPQTGGGPDVAYGDRKSMNLQSGEMSYRVGRNEPPMASVPLRFEGAVDTTDRAASEFIRCIREREEPFAGLEVGTIAALTALLARKSIYEKREVTWEQLLKEDAPLKRRA